MVLVRLLMVILHPVVAVVALQVLHPLLLRHLFGRDYGFAQERVWRLAIFNFRCSCSDRLVDEYGTALVLIIVDAVRLDREPGWHFE